MNFIAKKNELCRILKNVGKAVDDNSSVEMLKGIYMECSAETNEIIMIATNYAISIQDRCGAVIKKSGKMVLNTRLLTSIVNHMPEEEISFIAKSDNSVEIKSGKSIFTMRTLDAQHYPLPIMPFPENLTKVTNICNIAKKTVFAAAQQEEHIAFQAVCFNILETSINAVACDGKRIAYVQEKAQSYGKTQYLLPAKSFLLLASISSNDDIYDIGNVGNTVVFMKGNLWFSLKQIEAKYIDANALIKQIVPEYRIVTFADKVYEALSMIPISSEEYSFNLVLQEKSLTIKYISKKSEFNMSIPAKVSAKNVDGFHYNLRHMLPIFKALEGKILIEIDKSGLMLARSENEIYFQSSLNIKRKKATMDKTKREKQPDGKAA